jgi:hypothetical protein
MSETIATASTPENGRARGGVALRRGDRLVWTQPDSARIYVIVSRLSPHGAPRVAYLRCHYAGKVWTRRHVLPLFLSMQHRHWTDDDLRSSL